MRQFLELGRIVNTHGVHGEMRMLPWSDEAIYDIDKVYIGVDKTPSRVISARPHKQFILIKLEGVEDMDGAQALKNTVLYADREDMPETAEGEWYIGDLEGMTALLSDGSVLGTVKEVLITGANDVLVISCEDGKERLVPLIDDCVKDVDVEKGTMLITPLEGLFDD